jgi:hypothetical protein
MRRMAGLKTSMRLTSTRRGGRRLRAGGGAMVLVSKVAVKTKPLIFGNENYYHLTVEFALDQGLKRVKAAVGLAGLGLFDLK